MRLYRNTFYEEENYEKETCSIDSDRKHGTVVYSLWQQLRSKGTKESSKKTEASAETPKEEAKEEVKEPVVLTGKWEYKDDDGTWMQADITEDTITINWIMDEGNTTAVYWVGTYTAPTEYSEEYTWTSTRDKEATDSALLASLDDKRVFLFRFKQADYLSGNSFWNNKNYNP